MGRRRKAKLTAEDLAEWQLAPEYRAGKLLAKVDSTNEVMLLAGELLKQTRAIRGGNLDRAGDILAAQAHSLDALFNKLARLALAPGNGACAERFLRLAFRAQAQCARTLEVLGNLKNPPVVYAKQANVTTGPQQVNNLAPAQGREKVVLAGGGGENGQSKLLEATHGERLDFGAQGAAGGANPPLEALGAVNRPED